MMPAGPSGNGGGVPSPRGKAARAEKGGTIDPGPLTAAPPEDDSPGLPGFQRWSTVYLFVFVVFVFVVISLAIFGSVFG